MAKTNFDRYVEKRGKAASAESRAAREVFTQAYVFASALTRPQYLVSICIYVCPGA